MRRPWIEFRKWPYEPDTLHFEIAASDGTFSGAQDFYLGTTDIEKLADRLRGFPRDTNDEAVLDIGERDERWAYWVRLRFWLYDAVGHAALTIDLTNNRKQQHDRSVRFTIQTEVASFNRLGEALASWLSSEQASFRHEFTPQGA